MDTAPDARVIDVLNHRLMQLGLIRRKSRSCSPSSSSNRSVNLLLPHLLAKALHIGHLAALVALKNTHGSVKEKNKTEIKKTVKFVDEV